MNQSFNAQQKSSTGLDGNIAALLSYLGTIVTGIIFFLLEKESRFVKFHAMQSIIISVAYFVINLVFNFVPFIGGVLRTLFGLAALAIWIVSMVKAYQGETFKLPVAGDIAEKQAVK